MPNAPGDRGANPAGGRPDERATESNPIVPDDPETETVVIKGDSADASAVNPEGQQRERRFTAPGFDAKETQVIATSADPATEVFGPAPGQPRPGTSGQGGPPHGQAGPPPGQPGGPPKSAVPQSIPAKFPGRLASSKQFNWGWVLAIVVIVLSLIAIAVLGTVLLTRGKHSKVSEEDKVRTTIEQFDIALQRGDLTALRGMTCGTTRDGYVDYDEHSWQETYQRVAAAKQYPVIASVDQVIVNGRHAEANVTTFMAYDPQTRSTRSLDLQYRDDQWKVCQSPTG
jgi:hypothetical protein